jgi:hypothetical protein
VRRYEVESKSTTPAQKQKQAAATKPTANQQQRLPGSMNLNRPLQSQKLGL